MKKIFLLLFSIALCMFMVYLPSQLNFVYRFEVQLKDYLIVLIVPVFLSVIIALFIYPKKYYLQRLFPAIIISYLLMFGFMGYLLIENYIENQKIINDARKEAQADIKKGIVKRIEGTGLILPDKNYFKRKEVFDSLEINKYGFYTMSTGCIIDVRNDYYNEVVDKYLEKRNGKNWKKEYEKDILEIIKKYPIKE